MAKTATYALIASQTASGSSGVITFSSIPATYTDLICVISAVGGGGAAQLTVNGDTGTNYSRTFMYGTGSTAASSRSSNSGAFIFTIGSVSGAFSASILHLMDYSNSTTNKTFLLRGNDPSDATTAHVGLWRSTAAINSITLTAASSGNYSSGSTFKLYGIQAGSN